MYIGIQFKDKAKNFRGKIYDFKLHPEEKVPKVGSIIRVLDEDYNYKFYGTRVKVVDVKTESTSAAEQLIRYIETSLD